METFFRDVRFGLRILLKNPGFTTFAILLRPGPQGHPNRSNRRAPSRVIRAIIEIGFEGATRLYRRLSL
jgi:hypothetical protein